MTVEKLLLQESFWFLNLPLLILLTFQLGTGIASYDMFDEHDVTVNVTEAKEKLFMTLPLAPGLLRNKLSYYFQR